MRFLRRLFPLVLAAGWAWFIYWVSSAPVPPGTDATDGSSFLDFLPRGDLFAHAAVYAVLTWFLVLAAVPVRFCKPLNVTLHFLMPVVIAGVYGIAMEFVQDGIPERSAEALDVVADIAGAILTIAFMVKVWPKIKRLGRATAAYL
jgi:hypothetical protein